MSRAEIVRELVKDPSLRVTDIAKQTGYNKGHVSRLRKEAMKNSSGFECPKCGHCRQTLEPFEYWNAVEGWVKIDEMREHFDEVGCGTIYKSGGEGRSPLYTAPQKQWVGLTLEEHDNIKNNYHNMTWTLEMFARAIESKLKEKNG